jgi:hypothetical protein
LRIVNQERHEKPSKFSLGVTMVMMT